MNNNKTFFGQKISEEGLKQGKVDYAALGGLIDAVLNCKIVEVTSQAGFEWELVNGSITDEEGDFLTICQYYVLSESSAEFLIEETNEIVFYNEDLDMYVWGITFFGMSWDYVMTDIPI